MTDSGFKLNRLYRVIFASYAIFFRSACKRAVLVRNVCSWVVSACFFVFLLCCCVSCKKIAVL